MNIRELARRAGVSPSTVSRVLNQSVYVSEELRERVFKAIEETEYVPNTMKRHDRAIAFIVPSRFTASATWSATILDGVVEAAREYYVCIIRQDRLPVATTEDRKHYWRQLFLRHGMKGAIVVPGPDSARIIDDLREVKVPFVIFGRGDRSKENWVWCDNIDVVERSLTFLHNLGHRRIAFVGYRTPYPDHIDRLDAYQHWTRTAGARPEIVAVSNADQLAPELDALLSQAERPTALFIADENLGARTLARLNDMGLNVPKDISVITMGTNPILDSWSPRPTMVMRRLREGAEKAVELFVETVDRPARTPRSIVIPSDLVLGDSVSPPAGLR